MSSNKKFPAISKVIREREEHSKTVLRKCIRESSGSDKSSAWNSKRSYGWETRHLLLMYARVRGLPYALCEKKCHEAPSEYRVATLIEEHGFESAGTQAIGLWFQGETVSPLKLKQKEQPTVIESVKAPEPVKEGLFASLIRRFV